MSTRIKHILMLCIPFLICVGFGLTLPVLQPIPVTLITTKKVFKAGDHIVLDFACDTTLVSQLVLKTSYGSTVISSSNGKFIFPDYISKKKGNIEYILLQNRKSVYNGKLTIIENQDLPIKLETYIGPPSIIAGGKDYTMHIVVPTDGYDNPLADSTAVTFKHQFLGLQKEDTAVTNSMIGWKNVLSYPQKGKLLLSSSMATTDSKEYTVEVYPSLPENFEISQFREHEYADGNQIITLETSVIKDAFDNIVSDGTQVVFIIQNTKGAFLKSLGATINGVAKGKLAHPDHQDTWQVKAYIEGIAESNTLPITFKPVLEDFEIALSTDNRIITVGPLTSFMKQLIPDGAVVILEVFKDKKKVETKVKTSSDGVVKFVLEDGFYPNGTYTINLIALGVKKSIHNLELQ